MDVWVNKNQVKLLVKQTLASFKGVAENLASKVITMIKLQFHTTNHVRTKMGMDATWSA